MDGFIKVVAIIVIAIYVVVAICVICECENWKSTLGASLGFLAGGGVIIPIAYFLATIICYLLLGIVIVTVFLGIIGALEG